MKTALLAAAALSLLTAGLAQAQTPTNGTFVGPRNHRSQAPIAPLAPRTDGVIPRAARSGNVLQMFNPFAPAEYGSGQEVVRHEDNDPYQNPRGIKLATVEF